MTELQPRDFVTSFARGLSVIESFSETARRQTLVQIAAATGLSRAATRRFLLTLVSLGFARTDGRYFELTPAIMRLGFAYLSSQDLWELAEPVLIAVSGDLNESCSAAVLDRDQIVYVARAAARHRVVPLTLRIGTRLPAHATAMGHVLLAGLQKEELEEYFRTATLDRLTDRTLVTRAALQARLALVAQRGHAVVDAELIAGQRSLALPIRDPRGGVIAAINVSTNTGRFPVQEMESRFLPRLREAAKEIETIVRSRGFEDRARNGGRMSAADESGLK